MTADADGAEQPSAFAPRLTVPGGLPRGLVPRESVVAPVGSSIDLGDGAILALLSPLERRG